MDWERFLQENNIHYVTRGPNTKRGEFSIKCPMCEDDPSEHLGINPVSGSWGCHRNQAHRGKSPRILVKAILNCSSSQAGYIVRQYSKADPDDLDALVLALSGDDPWKKEVTDKEIKKRLAPTLADFSEIRPRGSTMRFFKYLQNRGYTNPQDVIKNYNLRCALIGRYKDRIIIPIYLNKELLGWTSRAIVNPVNSPRYLMSSDEIKTTVYNYDELKKGGKRLFIVEGPFDAIRVDSWGANNGGFRATCTFGTSVTISQIALLRSLVKKYDEAYVLFDQGADGPASNLAEWTKATQISLPGNVKDPGELSDYHLSTMNDPTIFINKYWNLGISLNPWKSPYTTSKV